MSAIGGDLGTIPARKGVEHRAGELGRTTERGEQRGSTGLVGVEPIQHLDPEEQRGDGVGHVLDGNGVGEGCTGQAAAQGPGHQVVPRLQDLDDPWPDVTVRRPAGDDGGEGRVVTIVLGAVQGDGDTDEVVQGLDLFQLSPEPLDPALVRPLQRGQQQLLDGTEVVEHERLIESAGARDHPDTGADETFGSYRFECRIDDAVAGFLPATAVLALDHRHQFWLLRSRDARSSPDSTEPGRPGPTSDVTLGPVTAPLVDDALAGRIDTLLNTIIDIGPTIVALSGGVDSALLAVAAARALPADQVLAVTADSPSLGSGELDHCRELTTEWEVPWTSVKTNELNDDRYLANDGDRCYWCKSALMDQLEPLARAQAATVTLGVNLDDLGDHRPGQQAAAERGARFPLVEAGFTKTDIRAVAKHWGLAVWDRPAMPCLSSRLPYGTEVTVPLLSRIDRAEQALHQLGFGDLRVRHYDETARIELPADDFSRAVEQAEAIVDAINAVGYRYVTLDLAGLRSGNLNQALAP